MKKTVFDQHTAAQRMVDDYASLERNLREMRTVLAAICFQQPDKCLTVPFMTLETLPPGIELEVSVDRETDSFQFSLVGADGIRLGEAAVGEGTGLALDDHVTSGLG